MFESGGWREARSCGKGVTVGKASGKLDPEIVTGGGARIMNWEPGLLACIGAGEAVGEENFTTFEPDESGCSMGVATGRFAGIVDGTVYR